MAYRDENDALRSRVAELEAELAATRAQVARLSGSGPRSPAREQARHSALLGAPTWIELDRELDFEIADVGFEKIAVAMGPQANVRQVGRTLRGGSFFLESRDGKTRVRALGDYRALPFGAVSCTLLGAFLFALFAFAIVHDFFARGLAERNFLWMGAVAVALLFPLARWVGKRSAAERARQLTENFERILELARMHAISAAPIRIALPPESSEATSGGMAAEREYAAEQELEAPRTGARMHK